MLSESEQRSWDEIERTWEPHARQGNGIPALAVGAAGIAIMLALVGAPWVAVVVLAIPVLVWLLSRYWHDIGTACAATLVPMDGWVAAPDESSRTPQSS